MAGPIPLEEPNVRSLHRPGEEGDEPRPAGGPEVQPRVHRHRAHPARARPGRQRRRGQRPRRRWAWTWRRSGKRSRRSSRRVRRWSTMGNLPFTPRAKKVLELAMEEASQLGHNYIGTEHLLLGLIKENEGIAAQVLLNLRRQARGRPAAGAGVPRRRPVGGEDMDAPEIGGAPTASSKSKTPALDTFGRDLTELARESKLDPVIGREQGDRARHPDPLPPHQEQPGAHRRGRRRQDRHRRGPGPGNRRGNVPELLRDKRVVTSTSR
jgi:hypothetical protein